jgi:hypothetical protein
MGTLLLKHFTDRWEGLLNPVRYLQVPRAPQLSTVFIDAGIKEVNNCDAKARTKFRGGTKTLPRACRAKRMSKPGEGRRSVTTKKSSDEQKPTDLTTSQRFETLSEPRVVLTASESGSAKSKAAAFDVGRA